jgi:hypothetical protein
VSWKKPVVSLKSIPSGSSRTAAPGLGIDPDGLELERLSPDVWAQNGHELFRFLLRHGEPPDPAVLVTAVPNWTVGETFSTSRGDEWRILAIDTDIDDELVEHGINAVFTVEPV